jgi:hypothetical protein
MPEGSKANFASRFGSTLRRWLRRFFVIFLIVFAAVGLLTAGLQTLSWISDGRWTIEEFQRLLAGEEAKRLFDPLRAIIKYFWDNGSKITQNVSFLLLAIAVFLAAVRIKLVANIMSNFLTARGPIYNLQSTIMKVEDTVQKLSDLQPTFELVNEKVDALQKQLADLQRYTSSERTDPADEGAGPLGTRPLEDDSGNWERLRELWYANTARIEAVIERISDRRRKLRYDRMPRTNYAFIIKALARDGLISEAVEKASIDLNATFLRYRPRNRRIPDDVIGALEVLDKLLAREIGNPPPIDEP